MLKKTPASERRGVSTRAPDEAVTPFDYTEAEWAEIEASVQIVKKGPLRKSTRKALQAAACAYLCDAAQREKRRELKEHWAKVDTLSQSLHRELSTCVDWCASGASFDEFMQLRADFAVAGLSYVNLIGAVARAARHDLDRKVSPRLEYQSKVLKIWVQLGGNLRISRHYKSQRVQGPLAKYFFAVVRPVMGSAVPSPESLPSIVKRQKLSMPPTEVIMQRPKWYDLRALYDRFCAQVGDTEQLKDQVRQLEAENEVFRAKQASDRAERAVKLAISDNGKTQKD
jgi:hypothetical protein